MTNFWDHISIKKLSLGYEFNKDKDIVSLIFINYFTILIFSIVVVLIHTFEDGLHLVSYRYHGIAVLGIINLILIRMGWTRIAKLLIVTTIPFLLLILPPIAKVSDNEFYFWFPYVPIALSLIPHFIFKPIKDRAILVTILVLYFFLILFIDDIMIFFSEGEEEIIPIVQQTGFYYNLIPIFIYAFVNIALGLIFRQNAKYEEIMKKQQDELIQSEKMASLGVLTAGIAHEINNPLNFISGSLTALDSLGDEFFLLDDSQNDRKMEIIAQREKLLRNTFEGVDRAAEIVKSLKQFSSRGSDKKSEISIPELLDSVLLMLHSKIPANVEVRKEFEQIPRVPCFEHKIHQVFMNILNNAIDAITNIEKMDSAIIKISVKAKEIDQKKYAAILIENSGPLIPEDHIRKIFDPFFTTKDPGKGVGLGMSISYNIIREHRGNLTVSNKNNMVSFEVTLPLEAI